MKRVGVATLIAGNNSETIENEYPWVAAIYNEEEHKCGGSIISESYVLSGIYHFFFFFFLIIFSNFIFSGPLLCNNPGGADG